MLQVLQQLLVLQLVRVFVHQKNVEVAGALVLVLALVLEALALVLEALALVLVLLSVSVPSLILKTNHAQP